MLAHNILRKAYTVHTYIQLLLRKTADYCRLSPLLNSQPSQQLLLTAIDSTQEELYNISQLVSEYAV